MAKAKDQAAPPARTGYSGKPLYEKLGIIKGMNVALLGAPEEYFRWLELEEADVKTSTKVVPATELVHLFVRSAAELRAKLAKVLASPPESAKSVWVSWQKGGRSDVKEDQIRELAPAFGWVDVKVCSVSDEWSGLKLMRRKK